MPFSPDSETLHEEGFVKRDGVHSQAPFLMGSPLIHSLKEDNDFKKAFEKEVETAARKLVQKEQSQLLDDARKKAEAQGFQEGMKRAELENSSAMKRLEEIVNQIHEEKYALLKSHEKSWLAAIKRILDVFGVPGRKAIVDDLGQWLRTLLGDKTRGGPIEVMVSESVVREMATSIPKGIVLTSDSTLSPGEIRVNSQGTEHFFSMEAQWQQIEQILQTHSSGEGVD